MEYTKKEIVEFAICYALFLLVVIVIGFRIFNSIQFVFFMGISFPIMFIIIKKAKINLHK